MIIRPGGEGDVRAAALLHAHAIDEGFLPKLGTPFLIRLYRRIVRWPGSFLLVADESGDVIGQTAATEDVTRLYREFLVRDGLAAGISAAPGLVRHWRSVLETLRYGAASHSAAPGGAGELPHAELLAAAVARDFRGRGIGRDLVNAANAELARRGVSNARVVVASTNAAALRMYSSSGYRPRTQVQVHGDRASEVLTWS